MNKPESTNAHEAHVPNALNNERVDRIVSLVADVSRNEAAALISSENVFVNGVIPSKPSVKLRADDFLQITVPYVDRSIKADDDVSVSIVHEDDHVLVIDKTAGLVVHPGSGTSSGTLVQGLLTRFPELASVGSDPDRPGVVHRLDKGTTGLLMVARTQLAYESLTEQLRDRSVMRRYLTLAWGKVEAASGLIDAPLGRSPNDAVRQAVVAGGREARTTYEVLERFTEPDLTLMQCRLQTGRTHQIRVHLEAIGNPVVGDDRYGGGSRSRRGLTRPFLHAEMLGFAHPDTGEQLTFESGLPADLTSMLEQCRQSEGVDAED